MDERRLRIVEKPPTVTFPPVTHRNARRQTRRIMIMYTKIQVVFDAAVG